MSETGETPETKKPSFTTRIVSNVLSKAIIKSLKPEEDGKGNGGQIVKEALRQTTEAISKDPKLEEEVTETGAGLLADQITETKEQILNNSQGLLQEAATRISPEKKTTYARLREAIRIPNESPLRKVFNGFISRLLTFGVKTSSYISAAFLDKFTGKDEREINQQNIETIYASTMEKAITAMRSPAAPATQTTAA